VVDQLWYFELLLFEHNIDKIKLEQGFSVTEQGP